MNSELDLTTASREALLTLIAELRATVAHRQSIIKQLQKWIAELEARLGGTRIWWPARQQAGERQATAAEATEATAAGVCQPTDGPNQTGRACSGECPDCGCKLMGGRVQYTREVIEVPIAPVEVTEHVYIARVCPLFKKRQVPRADLGGVVVGQQRLGVNFVSRIVTLREEGRLPVRTIQWYLATFHRLALGVGAIVGVLHQAPRQAGATVEGIRAEVRQSPAVCADEIGWRQDGSSGYVWVFSLPGQRLFLRRGRNKEVIDEVLGEGFGGVFVSDLYAGYDHYPGLDQRCWPHLLRDIHSLRVIYPDDTALAEWAEAVRALFVEAKVLHSADGRERQRAQRWYEQRLLGLFLPLADDPLAVQARLCQRMRRHVKELFVFVSEVGVPADKNQAERSLRHLVSSREISGGTRSGQGTAINTILASVFGTWRAKGLSPFHQCRQLLTSPPSLK